MESVAVEFGIMQEIDLSIISANVEEGIGGKGQKLTVIIQDDSLNPYRPKVKQVVITQAAKDQLCANCTDATQGVCPGLQVSDNLLQRLFSNKDTVFSDPPYCANKKITVPINS